MSEDINSNAPVTTPMVQIQPKVIEQKTEETFEEMCERLGLDPRCTCTFRPKECRT